MTVAPAANVNDEVRSEQLERIMQLAAAERAARNSPQWKIAIEDAIDAHGEACDRLYDEIYRQLDQRAADGQTVEKWKAPPDVRQELKKSLTRALKADLPGMVARMVEEIIDEQ